MTVKKEFGVEFSPEEEVTRGGSNHPRGWFLPCSLVRRKRSTEKRSRRKTLNPSLRMLGKKSGPGKTGKGREESRGIFQNRGRIRIEGGRGKC